MVKFFRFYTDRIGHLASNTELFLREAYNPNEKYIGLVDDYISNKTLLNMFSRTFCDRIIYNKLFTKFIHKFKPKNYIFHYDFRPHAYKSFKGKPVLKFTTKENWIGMKTLKMMGIDSWYVCFHSRDSTYLDKRKKTHRDFSYHDYRDCDIKNQLKAMEYITKQGGYAIRMGHMVKEPLKTDNPRIIDYATKYRNDFMDIYLPAHAKFFVGTSAGLINIAYLFNTPIAAINVTPLEYIDIPKQGIFIPKLIYSKNLKRKLTFQEILDNGYGTLLRTMQFTSKGLINIENTPDEILELCKELNKRINGTWKNKNINLQKKYWDLIQPWHRCYGCSTPIGSNFIKKYEELLE